MSTTEVLDKEEESRMSGGESHPGGESGESRKTGEEEETEKVIEMVDLDDNKEDGNGKEGEEEVTVLQVNNADDQDGKAKGAATTHEVILIDDEDEDMENSNNDNDDSLIIDEDDDDILMDDEVYTPQGQDTYTTTATTEGGDNNYYTTATAEATTAGAGAETEPNNPPMNSSSEFESNFVDALRYANVARQILNSRHPKFRHLNNMEIVHRMVAKGKVVNPTDDDEDEESSKDMFLSPREAKLLEQSEGVRVCTEMRSVDDRSGTEIIEVPEAGGQIPGLKAKVLVLGGGIPLEPVLAQKKMNEEVEKFRYDLQKHRQCWDNVVFKHPQRRVGWKVDPSTIVPKNNDENDPGAAGAAATSTAAATAPVASSGRVYSTPLFKPGEIYSTDEDWDVELGKDNELAEGSISVWTFLEDDEEEVVQQQTPPRPSPSYNVTHQQTALGKYQQQLAQKKNSPSPQKVYLSQIQQQNHGQLAEYFNQRLVAEGISKKASNKSRPSNRSSEPKRNPKDGKIYPKPAFSYSCLIALALKNSKTGALPVSEIYKFMCDHFPYFNTAPSGWKNSVRHNLSLNKCFEKYGESPPNAVGSNGSRKGCLWTLNPTKIHKMDEEVQKWSRKDPTSITVAMSDPENLELIERGELKKDYSGVNSDDEEDEVLIDGNPMTYTLTSGMPLEFGTITSVTGNYVSDGSTIQDTSVMPGTQLFAAPDSNGVMTYSVVSKPGQSTTPLIIRRTVLKS